MLAERKLDRVVVKWMREIEGSVEFAIIRTADAIYDRAAVVLESEDNLTVEFPRSTGNKDRPWKIIRNIIPKRRVVSIQYYVD